MSVVMLTKTLVQICHIQAGRDRFESGIPADCQVLFGQTRRGHFTLRNLTTMGYLSQTTMFPCSYNYCTPWTALTKQQYRFRYVNGAAAQTKFRLVQQARGMELTTVDLSPLENRIDAITSGDTPATAQLTGSNMELYGKTLDDRPAANTVKAGTTFTIVDDKLDQNWISDGTDWLEV